MPHTEKYTTALATAMPRSKFIRFRDAGGRSCSTRCMDLPAAAREARRLPTAAEAADKLGLARATLVAPIQTATKKTVSITTLSATWPTWNQWAGMLTKHWLAGLLSIADAPTTSPTAAEARCMLFRILYGSREADCASGWLETGSKPLTAGADVSAVAFRDVACARQTSAHWFAEMAMLVVSVGMSRVDNVTTSRMNSRDRYWMMMRLMPLSRSTLILPACLYERNDVKSKKATSAPTDRSGNIQVRALPLGHR